PAALRRGRWAWLSQIARRSSYSSPIERDTMNLLEIVFWLSAACVIYTYIGYPLLLAAMARLWPRGRTRVGQPPDSPVSVVLAAHNEEFRIGARIRELVGLVTARPAGGELIVVSDGSTDRTVAEAQAAASRAASADGGRIRVRVLVQELRLGKAMALNQAHAAARHPILVFADARQFWADDAIDRLVAVFG